MSEEADPSRLNIERPMNIALPTAESEEIMALRRTEWARVRRQVESLGDPLVQASVLAPAFFGVAVTAAFSVIPLIGAAQEVESWVVPTYIVTAAAAALLTFVCWWFGRVIRRQRKNDALNLCEEMDAIEQRYKISKGT